MLLECLLVAREFLGLMFSVELHPGNKDGLIGRKRGSLTGTDGYTMAKVLKY
jgi:hypothetical protein